MNAVLQLGDRNEPVAVQVVFFEYFLDYTRTLLVLLAQIAEAGLPAAEDCPDVP